MSIVSPGPLNWQNPIVDREGRPTPEFMRWLQDVLYNAETLDGLIAELQALISALEAGVFLPVVDGSVPPVFIQNPDGSLVYGEI